MKSCLKLAGLGAAFATTGLHAAVTINDNLSFDGYVIGAGVVTEGTPDDNGPEFGKSAFFYDSAYIALNGTYGAFSGKVSLYAVAPFDNNVDDNVGVLDAFVTYTAGAVSVTAGKYLGYLGYESFHSPNNAFISFSNVLYASPFATGVKVDYAGEGFSTGISIRDSQIVRGDGFFEGDGEIRDDIGFEAFLLVTSLENLTLFAGAGYEDVEDFDIGGALTLNLWASYAITEQFSLAGEIATLEDATDFSWLIQGNYAATEDLSVSARITGFDGIEGLSDVIGYGLASTYTITENFSVKGEITLSDIDGGDEISSYAIQALFRF